jgi:hypothetical protein
VTFHALQFCPLFILLHYFHTFRDNQFLTTAFLTSIQLSTINIPNRIKQDNIHIKGFINNAPEILATPVNNTPLNSKVSTTGRITNKRAGTPIDTIIF